MIKVSCSETVEPDIPTTSVIDTVPRPDGKQGGARVDAIREA